MKKYSFFALAALALAGCATDDLGSYGEQNATDHDAISFQGLPMNQTRAGETTGATAAGKLGGMFVVEGTKGTEQTSSPSTTVVFDNYLVGYSANSAATTETNIYNWEYVNMQSGIAGRMTGTTWSALHPKGDGVAAEQSVKYWDYSTDQYDFIAWSTGNREAVTTDPVSGSAVKVTRIATGTNLASNGFQMTALTANDLLECYYTDIKTVKKANYKDAVTLQFKNMASKVRVAFYETVPGYSIKDIEFYNDDNAALSKTHDVYTKVQNVTAGTTTVTGYYTESSGTYTQITTEGEKAVDGTTYYSKATYGADTHSATLFTASSEALPQSGVVTVYYPHMGTTNRDASPQTKDYNKASVTVTSVTGGATSTTQAFGELTNQYRAATGNEKAGDKYIGMTSATATFAGDATKSYYTAVIPNPNGNVLTLRVNYTLVSTDGVDEEIKVYGAKAVIPSAYAKWQPNYAYTYIFKISDNTNGWTSKLDTDPAGLYPITFDAVVANFTDFNAQQTSVTTVATPSISTYQQGHNTTDDNYSKSQKAGVSTDVKKVYVQVMANSALKNDLNATGKSLLYAVSKAEATEAEVMSALEKRTNTYNATSPVGRNGITLTANTNIDNTVQKIVNGADDQPITVTQNTAAAIDIKELAVGTYAYVYATTVPTSDEKVYSLAALPATPQAADVANYYEVSLTGTETPLASESQAAAGKVYFVKNVDANGAFVSYTFKQTKVGDDVTGLVEATIPSAKATSYTAGKFYFDVYNKNNGQYAVKVIKVVE